jgi:hypothetical protein
MFKKHGKALRLRHARAASVIKSLSQVTPSRGIDERQ